jgi:uncharacterized protein
LKKTILTCQMPPLPNFPHWEKHPKQDIACLNNSPNSYNGPTVEAPHCHLEGHGVECHYLNTWGKWQPKQSTEDKDYGHDILLGTNTQKMYLATNTTIRPLIRRPDLPPLIFESWAHYLLTCGILVIAQLVYVLFGFGSGLIAVGALALVFPDIRDVVVLLLLVNLPAECWVAWKSRAEIRWRPIAALGTGIAVGIPLGAYILSHSKPDFILTVLGFFLIVVGIVFLRLPTAGKSTPRTWAAPPTGLAAGLLTGLFGTGGPPLIIWYHLASPNKAAFRGNLMAIFMLMTFLRVPSYAVAGLITPTRIFSMVTVLPAVFLGGWIGNRLHLEVSEIWFRRMVSALLVVLGLVQVF